MLVESKEYQREIGIDVCTLPCVKSLVGSCCVVQGAQLTDDLEGWDGGRVGGRLKREGIYGYLQLIHIVVQQKLTQYCKATIYQF